MLPAENARGKRATSNDNLVLENRRMYPHLMLTVLLQAHFDGQQIVLDEPYNLPANARLLVTLLDDSSSIETEEDWLRAVSSSDAFDFLADPAEDIYTSADGEPFRDAE